MKKLLTLIAIAFLLTGCSQREDYYVFSFDDFTIAPGYDDAEYLRLTFDLKLPEKLQAQAKLEDIEVYFWDNYFASVDLENDSRKEINIDKAKVSRLIFYLSNYPASVYKLGDIELKSSVRENCEIFKGEYVERNGYACAFGQKVGDKENIVILYGDIFNVDQDKLDHIEIYVE